MARAEPVMREPASPRRWLSIVGIGEDGVEGLVHLSELVHDQDGWQENYPEGKKIKAEIIHIDSRDRKISLSEKGAVERSAGDIEGYMQNQGEASARLGDVMGDLSRKLKSKAKS